MRRLGLAIALSLLAAAPASATTGWGCHQINSGASDPLNIRDAPSSSGSVVGRYHAGNQPIIALDAPELGQATLADVHFAETRHCEPMSGPLGARWCPVNMFDGSGYQSGWVKRRWVDHAECP